MKTLNKLILLALCILVTFPTAGLAQSCVDNISKTATRKHYLLNNDGTVSDTKTKLMWMQCSLGQKWSNGQCLGKTRTITWNKALQEANDFRFARYSNWRLPTIKELSRITELQCQQPAIDLKLFPHTPPVDYWTTTSFVNDEKLAWLVHFGFGENHTAKKSTSAVVRLVRPIDHQ